MWTDENWHESYCRGNEAIPKITFVPPVRVECGGWVGESNRIWIGRQREHSEQREIGMNDTTRSLQDDPEDHVCSLRQCRRRGSGWYRCFCDEQQAKENGMLV